MSLNTVQDVLLEQNVTSGTATSSFMSGLTTEKSRTTTSLRGCTMAIATPRWRNSPRRTAIPLFRTIWVRPYKPLIAREMWSGTAYLTSMGMYWNSEENETSYLSVSKVNTKMGKQDCIIIGSGITRLKQAVISHKTQ